jgi:AcrR family transcriptional regulator
MTKVSPEYRDARRAHIIAVARELFSSKGLAPTSMSDLVAAAGISMGAFYRYFDGKDALIAAVAEGPDCIIDGNLDPAESPGELVARVLASFAQPHGTAHAKLSAQIWGDAAVRPEVAEIVRARHSALREHLAAHLRETQSSAGADDFADVILAVLVGYAQLVAADIAVDPVRFQRALGQLLPDGEAYFGRHSPSSPR